MDPLRQLRWLIPPFFFIASIFLGGCFGGVIDYEFFQAKAFTDNVAAIVAAFIAAFTAIVLPLGFFLSAISILLLRLLSFLLHGFRIRTYEAVLPEDSWDRIWRKLGAIPSRHPSWYLFAAATFDHELLPEGIHNWMFRRWTTFNISFHSSTAIGLAYLVAPWLGIPRCYPWGTITVLLIVVLLSGAAVAWHQTMKMIEFQAHRIGTRNRKLRGPRGAQHAQ